MGFPLSEVVEGANLNKAERAPSRDHARSRTSRSQVKFRRDEANPEGCFPHSCTRQHYRREPGENNTEGRGRRETKRSQRDALALISVPRRRAHYIIVLVGGRSTSSARPRRYEQR